MGEEASRAWKGDSSVERAAALFDEWRDDSAAVSGPAGLGAVVRRPREEDSSDDDSGVEAAVVAGEEAGRMREDKAEEGGPAAAGLEEEAADSNADSEECLVDSEAPFKLASRGGPVDAEKRGDRGGRGANGDGSSSELESAAVGNCTECVLPADELVASVVCAALALLGPVVDRLVVAVRMCCLSLAGAWKAESQPAQNAAEQSAHCTLAVSLSHTLHTATAWDDLAGAVGLSGAREWLCLAAGLWS